MQEIPATTNVLSQSKNMARKLAIKGPTNDVNDKKTQLFRFHSCVFSYSYSVIIRLHRFVSRKRAELIWFEKIDFPKSITEILLNIRIFL